MPRDVARAGLYRGSINLWVEDALTREYLSTLWNDPSVFFLVGGGNEGVRAIVKDADEVGFANVFGLTDRDFRPTNKPGWNDPNRTFRTFVLPVHEIENYLLDSRSLRSSLFNNRGLSETDIQTIIEEAAGRLCWWAACREVVAELKRRFREPFVIDPPCTLNSQSAAKDHICNSPCDQRQLTFPTKVPSDSLGWIGSLKRTSDKSLFPMALGSCGHRITHQLRPINMNGRSILAVTSQLEFPPSDN